MSEQQKIVFTAEQLKLFERIFSREHFAVSLGPGWSNVTDDKELLESLVHNISQSIQLGREKGYIVCPKKSDT